MLEMLGSLVIFLLVGPLLVIGAAGVLLIVAALLPSSPRRIRERVRCPLTGRVVTADFVVPEWSAHPAEVASCTAFPDPARVTCARQCRERAEVVWGLPRGVFPRWALIASGLVTWGSTGSQAGDREEGR